jgi:hypothetical protein
VERDDQVVRVVPMVGIRTVTMVATMARNGPMTRAKARVRALASGVAGISISPLGTAEFVHQATSSSSRL